MVKAKLRYLRMSPRKVRLVADVVRGLDVKHAQNQLEFMNKRVAKPMLKLLNSAVANAKNNPEQSGLKEDNLFIKEIRVDEGQTLKRWMPRAFGRATPINKRSSHITLVLDENGHTKTLKHKNTETQKQKEEKSRDKKIDKNITVVSSLDEVKEMGKQEDMRAKDEKKPSTQEHKAEPFDVRSEGSGRSKQHLDKIRKREKGGVLKRVFRRKSV